MTTTEPRPKILTPEMAIAVGKRVVAHLVEQCNFDGDPEQAASDIAKCGSRHQDGYALARELDDRCYWDCDLELANALDVYSSEADREIAVAQKAWAERNAITPTLASGARVSVGHSESGVITGIYEYGPAQYLVAIDGDKRAAPPSNARRIVNFEDAAPIAQAAE